MQEPNLEIKSPEVEAEKEENSKMDNSESDELEDDFTFLLKEFNTNTKS